MIPPKEIQFKSVTFGDVTAQQTFKVSISGVNMVRYSSFRDEYTRIIKSYIYEMDKDTMIIYFYVPIQSILPLKSVLQIAKLKKKFKEYVIID